MSDKPLILVVDDDAPILLLMRNLLREFGFETATAANGRDALDGARRQSPDLVLVDKNMPGMDGAEVVRALRSDDQLRRIPVLILSGEPIDPAELRQIGADGAVLKPFDLPELIATIRQYVNDTA